MDVVLVSWTIRSDAVDQFKEENPDLSPETAGLIHEDLYRLDDAAPDGSVRFLRVGRWESREHFYAALGKFGVAPLTSPQPKEYETADCRREWLEWTRNDTPNSPAPGPIYGRP